MERNEWNQRYLREILGIDPVGNAKLFEQALKAMDKYSTPWWTGHFDAFTQANFQIDEPILLIRWEDFKRTVQTVLGRSVKDEELTSSNTDLIAEFHRKYQQRG